MAEADFAVFCLWLGCAIGLIWYLNHGLGRASFRYHFKQGLLAFVVTGLPMPFVEYVLQHLGS